jgi:hypothetical protein
MTPRLTRSFRRRFRASLALATVALSAAALTGTATAAPGDGEATLTLKRGAESSLLRQGVKVTYSAKAGKTDATKRAARKQGGSGVPQKVSLPVVDVDLATATVETGGALSFALKGEKATATGLQLKVGSDSTAISGKLGKERLVLFRAKGASTVDATGLGLNGAALSLTSSGADALRDALGMARLKDGELGRLSVNASVTPKAPGNTPATQPKGPGISPPETPLVDPYATQCNLKVKSRVSGSAATPAAEPTLSSPATLSGGSIAWGFSTSFRGYVIGSGGSIGAISPATVGAQPGEGFSFPTSGEYAFNSGSGSGDDQAVIDGSGEVVLCNDPHGFRITLSNPTVTIDGVNSRLTVDVDTNMTGAHTPTQRVDLATLDISGATPFYDENARTVTWPSLPVTLTAAGSEALNLCAGNPGPCTYEADAHLEALTVTATTATATAWPFDSSYCTLGSTAETTSWPPAPSALAALPTLSSPQAITSGAINWGVRNGLRNTVQNGPPPGVFNVSGGASRSDGVSMSGVGKFFTWPSTSGQYEAGTPGRLILAGTGVVGFCQTGHGFGTVFSNPTLVIDGANSRLTMSVATRFGTTWTSGRVDLATLAIGNVVVSKQTDTPAAGQETITWAFPDLGVDGAVGGGDDDADSSSSSVKLAAPGTSALWLLGATYRTAGLGLNKLTVSIVRSTS